MKLNPQNLKFDELFLAIDPSTPLETLDRLANVESSYVRECVARNPNTPPEGLVRLANDEHYLVRYWVALNLNTPPEALARLANDTDFWVRECVAGNPNTFQYIKDYLKICKFIEYYELPNY